MLRNHKINMAEKIYVGIAVTSNHDSEETTAVVKDLHITGFRNYGKGEISNNGTVMRCSNVFHEIQGQLELNAYIRVIGENWIKLGSNSVRYYVIKKGDIRPAIHQVYGFRGKRSITLVTIFFKKSNYLL